MVFFLVLKLSGISEDNDYWFSSLWWARPGVPWSHTWGLILSSHSFWSLPIGDSVMGSSVETRSCRALKSEKLPITRVVSSSERMHCVSCSVVPNSSQLHGLLPTRLLCLCPGKDTGVGCYFLLQEIFPTQGLSLGLLHCRQILYRLSYEVSLFPIRE